MNTIILSLYIAISPGVYLTWANFANGVWDIYVHDNQRGTVRLTNSSVDEYYPRFSLNGEWIYFVRKENEKYSIHRMNLDGKRDEWKIENAEYFSLISNSKMIFGSRNNKMVIKWIDLNTGKVTLDSSGDIPVSKKYILAEPDSTPDGKTIFMLTNRRGWSVEQVSKKEMEVKRIGGGCRPAVSGDGKLMAYVSNRGHGGTSIRVIKVESGEEVKVIDLPGELSHEYDPKFSNDGRWLLFSVCPNNQHDPKRGAQYEIWVYKWGSEEPAKKLFDLPGADWYPDIFFAR